MLRACTLDPTAPDKRLAHSLSQGDIALVLVAGDCIPNLLEAVDLMTSDNPRVSPDRRPASKNPPAIASGTDSDPRNLSYIIYTSGSTGAQKGAMIEQQGMMNHLFLKIDDLKLDQQSVVAQTAPQSFDIFVWQALAALLVGGSVHIVDDEYRRDPPRCMIWLNARASPYSRLFPFLRALLDLEEATTKSRSSVGLH